jgi:hypothetical protein
MSRQDSGEVNRYFGETRFMYDVDLLGRKHYFADPMNWFMPGVRV